MREFLDAILTGLIFFAFAAVLLTAPIWGAWIDGETLAWERDAADRHAAAYESVRCER